ncbi:ubiquitin-conjugating enzyme/RWD-like protein [Fennellomyces sp. T-0311]|nr:ubiquitin-conjugating enzyme/RWD-like protein [Fennellomyces sp. T-0311]
MSTRSELAPHALKKIAKELQSLERSPPEDIQVLNNEQDLTEIQAWIRGPDGTPYENGYFKVRLLLNEGYPDAPPKGYFSTKIFHPNVASSGEICVNTLKKDWKAELGIAHVLLTIKCLLIVPNPESALNEEAGKLLLEQYDDYAKRAKLYTNIHARLGKSEFQTLAAERAPQQPTKDDGKPETTQNENPSVTESPAATAGKQKEESPAPSNAAANKSANAVNVLTPSAVSNIAAQTSNMKRPAGEVQEGKDEVEPTSKQPRVEALPKKKTAPTADRKKRLRRL